MSRVSLVCAVLAVTACASHPRASIIATTAVVVASGLAMPYGHDCTPQPGANCGPTRTATIFGLGALGGGLLGLAFTQELEPDPRTP